MTKNDYSNREIDRFMFEIHEKLDLILAQTTKTNGRVTTCEKDIVTMKASGKIANWAFGLTIPLIIGMAVWIFFNQIEEMKRDLDKHDREYQYLIDQIK